MRNPTIRRSSLTAAVALLAMLSAGGALAQCSEGQMAEAQLQFSGAQQLLGAKQWNQAIPQLQSIVDFCPEYHPALRGLGMAYMQTGQFDLAAEVYRKTIEVLGDEAEAADFGNLAKVYTRQKKYKEARAEYLKAKARDPHNCAVLVNLGILHNASDHPMQAVDTLEDALTFCPDLSAQILPRLAEACHKAAAKQKQIGNADKAAMYAAKEREYGGSAGGTTAYKQIQARMKQQDFAGSIELCDQLLAKSPTHAGAMLTKARAADAIGRKQVSVEAYRGYLDLKPDDIDVTADMIIVMAEAEQCGEAVAASKTALQKFAGRGHKALGKIHFAYGKALFCAEDYAGAKAQFLTASRSGDPKWTGAARQGMSACDEYLNYQKAQRKKAAQGS